MPLPPSSPAFGRRALALVVAAVAVLLAAVLPAGGRQQAKGRDQADAKKAGRKGGVRVPVGLPPDKGAAARGDALGKAGADLGRRAAFRFELGTSRGDYLAATYYRSKDGDAAPVALLVHDKGRRRADFEEPIRELEGQTLAEALHARGFAVLAVDLRGHGDNPRTEREQSAKDWQGMTDDLEDAYTFLLDRHNHRELNLAKFAAVGLGAGANLVAHWAAAPESATAPMGRGGDLAALVLVSPRAEAEGMKLETDAPGFAFRLPALLVAGEKDDPAVDAIAAVQKVVERNRLSKVAYVAGSGLGGERLLKFGAQATEPILRFLDAAAKFRKDEWEGRFNLEPVAYRNVRPLPKAKAADGKAEAEPPGPDDPAKAKDDPAAKPKAAAKKKVAEP